MFTKKFAMNKSRTLLIVTIITYYFFLALNNCAFAQSNKIIVGRVEWVRLPQFNLKLEARIDTGARNCSLNAINPKEIEINGIKYVEFITFDSQKKELKLKAKIAKIKTIKSAGGSATRRYVIKTTVILGNVERDVFITLHDRTNMEYPFLVGRNLLRGKFIVDVSHSHLLER